MPRDYEVYLEDIRDAIVKVKRYDIEIIWDILENKLPALEEEINEILST